MSDQGSTYKNHKPTLGFGFSKNKTLRMISQPSTTVKPDFSCSIEDEATHLANLSVAEHKKNTKKIDDSDEKEKLSYEILKQEKPFEEVSVSVLNNADLSFKTHNLTTDPFFRLSYSSFVEEATPYLSIADYPDPPNSEVLKMVKAPLGVCYDELKEEWIIADSANDRIILYPTSFEISVESIIELPSAVCSFEPGKSIAILCKKAIVVFNYNNRECSFIHSSDDKLTYRGLGRTIGGNVATIRRQRYNAQIIIFSATAQNKCLGTFTFDNSMDCNPSFMHSVGDRLVISDLGQQKIYMCRLDDTNVDNISFDIVATHTNVCLNKGQEPEGGFAFVSGVQLDRDGCVIVADARGRTFQLFDRNLHFLQRLNVDIPVPYVSSFYVNNKGEIMICDRKDNKMVLAKLTSSNMISRLPIQRADMRHQKPHVGSPRMERHNQNSMRYPQQNQYQQSANRSRRPPRYERNQGYGNEEGNDWGEKSMKRGW